LLQPSALEQNIDKEAETADSVIMMAAPQHARKHYPMWILEKTHKKWIMQEVLTAEKTVQRDKCIRCVRRYKTIKQCIMKLERL